MIAASSSRTQPAYRPVGLPARNTLGVILSIIMLVSVGCSANSDQPPASVDDDGYPVTEMSFRSMPDGPPPATFGTGPATLNTAPFRDAGAALRVHGGLLTNSPAGPTGTAGYYTSANLGGPVRRIGARWVFLPRGTNGTDGAMALVVSQKAFDKPFPLHLVITPQNWWFGVWPPADAPGSKLEIVGGGPFATPLRIDSGTEHTVDVTLSGQRATIVLPDGSVKYVRDARIAEWAGPYATFEVYAGKGSDDVGVGFSKIWAGA